MDRDRVLSFIAAFWEMPESDVADGVELSEKDIPGLTSVRFFEFIAAIEAEFDVKVANIEKVLTVGDLIENMG